MRYNINIFVETKTEMVYTYVNLYLVLMRLYSKFWSSNDSNEVLLR